jgi:enamine deaminase RidA (YjgF/YER057c/UK114 family)
MAGAACAALEVIALRSTRSPDLAKYPPLGAIPAGVDTTDSGIQNGMFGRPSLSRGNLGQTSGLDGKPLAGICRASRAMLYGGPAHSRPVVAWSRGPPQYPTPHTRAMTIQLINPADLPPQATYTQLVVAAGTTMVFIVGQQPEDVHSNSVAPGDLAGQARQVYANLGRSPRQAPALTRSPSSPSTWRATNPNTCRLSSKPGWSYSGTTNPPTRSSAWRGWPGPSSSSRSTRLR